MNIETIDTAFRIGLGKTMQVVGVSAIVLLLITLYLVYQEIKEYKPKKVVKIMIGFNYDIIKLALDKGFIRKRDGVKLLNIVKYKRLTCEICKEPIPKSRNNKNKRLSFDHIRPKSKGGNGDFQNLQIVHKICNLRKGNKDDCR